LEWVIDESLRRTVRNGTTKIEWHHKFSRHLTFNAGGHLRSNDPADQEKAIVYNELATNAVALQNVVDQTRFSVKSHHMTLSKVANGSELAAAAVATA
jgi:TnpA family transposase